ncbi:APC family permease [Clostridium felsineum]|uniref:Potassium transporter KimA n=1 Tax=Clostridium felsineum TaxID=36839 RepID=A0A1S8LYZ2_9CLOT|nr:APC family permease [Clostridium felsineum]URZ09096.1 Potassium transporter KimA [Clostridium felsineum]URZ13783.1 Potassium transporter KimA [Clostridium felsineum]
MIDEFLDILLGKPLANEQSSHEKFNIPFGLAIMASDAISSVAYAAEEILIVLIAVVGIKAYTWLSITALMIIGLLTILTISYLQIIKAYPHGGGAYVVAKENIGTSAGLVAGAALLIDYILTVAVSASAGGAAILSAFPQLVRYKVPIVIIFIIVLTILNLRGISESSKIFSLPTYVFIISMIFMIILGIFKHVFLKEAVPPVNGAVLKQTGDVTILLILRAFSQGCSALTGIEAVSNSVPNFKEPSQRNAKIVMILLSVTIFFIFGGSTILANIYRAVPGENVTVLAQIAQGVFGKSFMFYLIQVVTAIILLMACNTAFTGFPMLMFVVANDGFAPRQFTHRGKRLSLSIGIGSLSLIAGLLVIVFNANTHHLLPLYSVGVFMSFTLAQTGMVICWRRNSSEKNWRIRALINGLGAVVTTITTAIIAYEKFKEGAWIVIVLIPILVFIMLSIKRHYNIVAEQLRVQLENYRDTFKKGKFKHIAVVPIASLNKASLGALQYAKGITDDVIALNISINKEQMEKLKIAWQELDTDIVLVSKYSQYRHVVTPLLEYIDQISAKAEADEKITVVLPQFITHKWWGKLLHNNTGFFLRESMLGNKNVIVSTYPYHLEDDE